MKTFRIAVRNEDGSKAIFEAEAACHDSAIALARAELPTAKTVLALAVGAQA